MFFGEILEIGKCEGAHFEYGNIFLKILVQKYPNKAFLVPNLGIFAFFSEFCNTAKSRVLISNMTIGL